MPRETISDAIDAYTAETTDDNNELAVENVLSGYDDDQIRAWVDALEQTGRLNIAFRGLRIDTALPTRMLSDVLNADEWEELDPQNIETIQCSMCEESAYNVETFYDTTGFYTDQMQQREYEDFGSMHIVDHRLPEGSQTPDGRFMVCDNCGSPSESGLQVKLTSFRPGETPDKMKCSGGFLSGDNVDGEAGYQSDNEDLNQLVAAILNEDEDAIPDGWAGVPVQQAEDDFDNLSDRLERVEEIIDTNEYYHDFPMVAVRDRTATRMGRGYVGVPEEHADLARSWFDPERYGGN